MTIKNILEIKSSDANEKQVSASVREGKIINSQKGFTLIEVIVTLVLVGILAALAGIGMVQAVQGYVVVKENSAITQKAQLAMSRITREIIELNNIYESTNANKLPITNISQTDASGNMIGNRIIEFIAAEKAVKINGVPLMKNVKSLTFDFYSGSGSWTYGSSIDSLSAIGVNMTVTNASGTDLNFYSLVSPRNNMNLGGADSSALASALANAAAGSTADWKFRGCFVATAAYGNPGHPMVQILRDFRDRHLIHWPGGKWFIQQYYKHGPAAADVIRDRPVAMLAVRCLLSPFVAIAFCLMYAPLLIPLVFSVAFIITLALFSAFRRKFTVSADILRSRGSILIGLIFTMVIMAVLAAAMIPLFSSATMNQVYADQGRRSYFLAESGYAYTASRFADAEDDAERDAVLADIHGKTYNLLDNAGSFKLEFYPFWFTTTSASSSLTTTVAGYAPDQFDNLSGGTIRLGPSSSGYTYHTYTSTTNFNGHVNTLTFNNVSPVPSETGLAAVPVVFASGSNAVTQGGNINIKAAGTSAFPMLNGTFTIDTVSGISSKLVFKYEKKVGNTLYNIKLADITKIWTNFTLTDNTKIVLNKFMRIYSTGTTGTASRQIIFNTPVGAVADTQATKMETLDKGMDKFPTAADKTVGGHVVVGGALKVTSTVDPSGLPTSGFAGWAAGVIRSFIYALRDLFDRKINYPGEWSVIGFDWTNEDTNLAKAYKAQGGTLSYDIQVKIDASDKKYFMNGIGFRLRSNAAETDAYGYGVSILRKRNTRYYVDGACITTFDDFGDYEDLAAGFGWKQNDGINSDFSSVGSGWSGEEQVEGNLVACLKAKYSDPVIALWQKSSTGIQVLAYRRITAADNLTTGSGSALRLNPWVTLMVRVIEGYELQFTSGRVDANGRHFKAGDTIKNLAGTKTARIVGTPVMLNAWGANNNTSIGSGRLMLANVTGSGFSSSEALYLVGGDGSSYGTASAAQAASKTNYIMVYYSDNKAPASGNTVQADNTRIGNIHYTTENSANWPPEDWTDRKAGLPTATPPGNDYFTLVKWDNVTPSGVLALTWATGNGWTQSGATLSRVQSTSFGPWTYFPVNAWTNWTNGGGEWDLSDGGIHHSYKLWSSNNWDAWAQYNGWTQTVGTPYNSVLTVHKTNGLGSAKYEIGSVNNSVSTMWSGDTETYDRWFIGSAQKPYFYCTNWWGGTIKEWKVRSYNNAGTATATLNVQAGVTYDVRVGATTLDTDPAETLSYTINGVTTTCTTGTSCNYSFTASTTGAMTLVFNSPNPLSEFTTGTISVTPRQDVLSNTWASLVPVGDTSADFYNAVIKTGQFVSPAGSSISDFVNGGADFIGLITSSFNGAGTFYDDFAVRLDSKTGVTFLPPIQQ